MTMTAEERARQSAHDAAVRLSDTMRGLSRDSQIGVLAGAIRAAEQEAELRGAERERNKLDIAHDQLITAAVELEKHRCEAIALTHARDPHREPAEQAGAGEIAAEIRGDRKSEAA